MIATVVDNKENGKWIANSVYRQLVRWYPGYLGGWSRDEHVSFVRLGSTWRPCDEAMCDRTTMEDYLPGVKPQTNKGFPVDVAVVPNANRPGSGLYIVMALRPQRGKGEPVT